MKKYIVVDETYHGDVETEVFDTPEAANVEARYLWNHLTDGEQKTRHIYAAVITEECLCEYARDEDTGEIDWRCYDRCDFFPGSFDSAHAN